VIDEPKFNGGQDLGADPFTMIVAGLVGCTLTTLRMYIRRKGWRIDDIRVDANMVQEQDPVRTIILRTIVLGQSVTDEQGEKPLHIAKNCPAARLLEGDIVIDTVLDGDVLRTRHITPEQSTASPYGDDSNVLSDL
jgi:putative redox protein